VDRVSRDPPERRAEWFTGSVSPGKLPVPAASVGVCVQHLEFRDAQHDRGADD
jgi:hypothetical protein